MQATYVLDFVGSILCSKSFSLDAWVLAFQKKYHFDSGTYAVGLNPIQAFLITT